MEQSEILKKSEYFKSLTFEYLTGCIESKDRKDYRSTVIMSAIFCEALLKDICEHFSISLPDGELNALIVTIRKHVKNNEDLSWKERNNLYNLLNRCDEIRRKRNRIVHDIGDTSSDMRTDAQDTYSNALIISSYYLASPVAPAVAESNNADAAKNEAECKSDTPIFKVFVSSITPHNVDQEVFLNAVCSQMWQIGLEPVRFQAGKFDKKDPMGKVLEQIKECHAFLVIGLERSHSYFTRDKEFSQSQKEDSHRKYTSGWLHIESGMAIALGMPVFVMCQHDICNDGIFDKDWNSYPVITFNTPLNPKSKVITEVLTEIKKRAVNNI